MSKLTDDHLQELEVQGFVIVPDFFEGEQLREMQEAQRRVLQTWEQVKDNPPPGRAVLRDFPVPEMVLLKPTVRQDAVEFAGKWLKTDKIHARVGCMIARYPGFKGGGTGYDDSGLHIDNGNNSLLPESKDLREFGQIGFWTHLEDVDIDQAPLRLIPKAYGKDMTKAVPLVCKAGTTCIFPRYTWHSASDYLREDGQRFTWGFSFGRADHYWEGFKHFTDKGAGKQYEVFHQFVGSLTAKQREIYRFPPAGHPYYTPATLALLEKQYPGWDSSEYLH